MKTNAAIQTNPMQVVYAEQSNSDQQLSLPIMTAKERNALKVIYSHAGKRRVFETYQSCNPEMARKYLDFVSKNPWAIYIRWDEEKREFVV
jgi:hypothetical protein